MDNSTKTHLPTHWNTNPFLSCQSGFQNGILKSNNLFILQQYGGHAAKSIDCFSFLFWLFMLLDTFWDQRKQFSSNNVKIHPWCWHLGGSYTTAQHRSYLAIHHSKFMTENALCNKHAHTMNSSNRQRKKSASLTKTSRIHPVINERLSRKKHLLLSLRFPEKSSIRHHK